MRVLVVLMLATLVLVPTTALAAPGKAAACDPRQQATMKVTRCDMRAPSPTFIAPTSAKSSPEPCRTMASGGGGRVVIIDPCTDPLASGKLAYERALSPGEPGFCAAYQSGYSRDGKPLSSTERMQQGGLCNGRAILEALDSGLDARREVRAPPGVMRGLPLRAK